MPQIYRLEAKCSNYCTCKKWSTFISLHGASEILAASLTPVQTLSKHNRSSEDNVRFSSMLPLLCPSPWHSELGTNRNSTFTVVFEVCSALLEVLRENRGYARATAHADASASRRSQTIWKAQFLCWTVWTKCHADTWTMNNIHMRYVVRMTSRTCWKSGTLYWHSTLIKCNRQPVSKHRLHWSVAAWKLLHWLTWFTVRKTVNMHIWLCKSWTTVIPSISLQLTDLSQVMEIFTESYISGTFALIVPEF